MSLLAIDPGVKRHGWGFFLDGALVACGKSPSLSLVVGAALDELVIELPQAYGLRGGKGEDKNDLIALAFEAGRVAGLLNPKTLHVTSPSNWKAQVPKEIVHNRCRRVLSPAEAGLLEGPNGRGFDHNVWDAVALGLWHLKRISRGGA